VLPVFSVFSTTLRTHLVRLGVPWRSSLRSSGGGGNAPSTTDATRPVRRATRDRRPGESGKPDPPPVSDAAPAQRLSARKALSASSRSQAASPPPRIPNEPLPALAPRDWSPPMPASTAVGTPAVRDSVAASVVTVGTDGVPPVAGAVVGTVTGTHMGTEAGTVVGAVLCCLVQRSCTDDRVPTANDWMTTRHSAHSPNPTPANKRRYYAGSASACQLKLLP
jgi:hypothetical protein